MAIEGEKTYKQLFEAKEVAKSNKTILYSLKHLEYMELIKSRLGNNKGYKGRKATYYSLTSDGLLMTLYYLQKQDMDRFINSLEAIARKQSKLLPLIFDKWEFYRKNNLLEEVSIRLVAALKVEGAFLEDFVELRRNNMEILLKQKDRFKEAMEEMKKYLTGSELKKFPKHPVFMSKQEKEQHIRAIFKTLRETWEELGSPNGEELGNSEANTLIDSMRNIDEGSSEITSRHLISVFLFGSNRYSLNAAKQTVFLKTVSQDKELRDFVQSFLETFEKDREIELENIRSWKNLVTEK